jgi:hypothetical protein
MRGRGGRGRSLEWGWGSTETHLRSVRVRLRSRAATMLRKPSNAMPFASKLASVWRGNKNGEKMRAAATGALNSSRQETQGKELQQNNKLTQAFGVTGFEIASQQGQWLQRPQGCFDSACVLQSNEIADRTSDRVAEGINTGRGRERVGKRGVRVVRGEDDITTHFSVRRPAEEAINGARTATPCDPSEFSCRLK